MPNTDPDTPTLLFIAHRFAETRVMDAIRTTGFADLTLAQCRIMQRLNPAGIRITDLAEQAGVTKQTAGGLIDELERSGYVERTPDPSDARARLVVLSGRGEKLCAAVAVEVKRIEEVWRTHVGPAAYETLQETLVSLREITDPFR